MKLRGMTVFFTVIMILMSLRAYAACDGEEYTLQRLGISDGNCEATTENMQKMLSKLTGEDVSVLSAEVDDVIADILKALKYEYMISDRTHKEEYIKLAEETGLLDNIDQTEGKVSYATFKQLIFNALGMSYIERKGYAADTSFEKNSTVSVIAKSFGGIYSSGSADGYYGDGVQRVNPLNKSEYIINNEKYVYYGPEDITKRQISFVYIKQNDTKEIVYIKKKHDIVIHERTGNSGMRFFRRGVPFAEGELYDVSLLRLRGSDGSEHELQCEALEKYPDGSIKWASISFMLEVEANKKYYFDILKAHKSDNGSFVKQNGTSIDMDNGILKVSTGEFGIAAMMHNGKNLLSSDGIRLVIENTTGVQYFHTTSAQIIADGSVYAQIKLHGYFTNSTAEADWYIYMYSGSGRIYQEVTLNVKGYTKLTSQYLETNFAEDLQNTVFEPTAKTGENIVFSNYINANEIGSNLTMASQDIVRFEKTAKTGGVYNGFVYGEDKKKVLFAPIHYNADFMWPDGVSRTTHLDMLVTDKALTEDELKRESEWCFTPPSLTVASDRFVNAKIIEDDVHSDVCGRIEKMVEDIYGKLWNNFQAGKLPNRILFEYKSRTSSPGDMDRSPGETEYNLWLAYMNCGNERLYDIICESAEQWSDVYIYRGDEILAYGCNRYFTGPYFGIQNGQFEMSQPFYGDLSGMYMTYLMTGDIRYRDTFRLSIDNIETGVAKNGVPTLSYWGSNRAVSHNTEYHARFMAQARGLAFAYRLFGDEKYLEAGKSIARFISEIQAPSGIFYESYDITTKKPIPGKQGRKLEPHAKLYIMLYGARPMLDFYKMTGYEPAKDSMIKLADFLLTEQEEDGWTWSPNSSNEIWDYGDKRGCDGVTNSLISTFFTDMYCATGDVKYFEAALKAIRFYVSMWSSNSDNNMLGVNRTNFLKGYEVMTHMIKCNERLALEMGYADVVGLMNENTAENLKEYADFDNMDRRCVLNAFDTAYGRIVYITTIATSLHSETYQDKFIDLDFKVSDERRLWFGDALKVKKDGTYLQREMQVVDLAHLLQTDIYLSGMSDDVDARILTYTPDKITLEIAGENSVVISVADGFYNAKEGSLHTVSTDGMSYEISARGSGIVTKVDLNSGRHIMEISRKGQ